MPTIWPSELGVLGAYPSEGILKAGALVVGSKLFFASQGEAGSWEFPLDYMALCWEWFLWQASLPLFLVSMWVMWVFYNFPDM